MNEISRNIGENIRAIRKQKGFSQEQLALRAEINGSYMGQVERGEKSPTIDVLSKIAHALQCPLEQLVHVDGALPEEISYADKIAYQLQGLTVKEQEAVYKFVKQLVQFKELD
ncbi:helix-turn-helix domain-containing protein [Paenibacillus glycanilyticus]|uniref:helix-turn-helix domain-containing protein n=1 Tax=Paenibacillus glycanilyticus TaxID=126569 RepID=UPI0020408A87|nr:helix-turn-helix transcriptional regulator [Paenibacillus glycanilyticus]MCM3630022.1 helix-turn-helix domain-containing protein [Paenibacillus glycanilyticus]